MAELRRDPIVGRWVVIDQDHQKFPGDFIKETNNIPSFDKTCQFCPGKEHFTPPEVDSLRPKDSKPNSAGWLVRTVPNKFPVLVTVGDVEKEAYGMFDVQSGVGAHEVVIETADHQKNLPDLSVEEMSFVLNQYLNRSKALGEDKRVEYVCVFKNFGFSAGATVEHAHSQIIALPMVPKLVNEELRGSQQYYQENKRCVFCDVLEQEYSDRDRIVAENKSFLAICPYAPRYAFETWIIPKAHSASFTDIQADTLLDLSAHLLDVLKRMRKVLSNPSYNFFIHTAPINYAKPECYH